jgi:hypothetical protein
MDKILAQFGIVHGQPFDYSALSLEKKAAMGIAAKAAQREFERIYVDPASIGGLKSGWVIPNPNLGNYGTDCNFRAGISFVGFGVEREFSFAG